MKFKHLSLVCVITILMISQILYAKEWAAKIDDETISMEDFNRFYYLMSKMITNVETNEEVDKLTENPAYANHPLLSKAGFLEHLIAQKLLYKKAMEDKAIDHKELTTLIEMIKIQAVAQYYISKKIKDKTIVSDEEVNKIYKENEAAFEGKTKDEAIAFIKHQIFTQKTKTETNQYIMNLLAESKVDKSGFRNSQIKNEKKLSSENKTEEKK